MAETIATWEPRVLSLLRFVVGLLFLEHGTTKLLGFPPNPRLAHLSAILWIAGIIETVGGALVTAGLFTRLAAFIMSGEMAVGYFISHAPRGLFPELNGGDAAILFCFVFLYLFVAGGGSLSLDRVWRG